MKRWNKLIWFSVWAIVLLVALYYRYVLWYVGFEYDEIFTAITSHPQLSWSWIWSHWLMIDVHPPLHNFILWLWNHVVPYGPEIWLRIPSLVFTAASLIMAWVLCPRRYGKMVRMAFLLLIATNGYSIIYSQHARAYALMLCLALPLTFLFLKMSRLIWHRREISRKQWVVFGVLSLLLCWSHYFGALLFGVMAAVLFVQACYYKRSLGPFIWVPALVVLLFLPWLVPNLWANIGLKRFDGDWWGNVKPWTDLPRSLTIFFFTSFIAAPVMAFLGVASLIQRFLQYRKKKVCVYAREMILLTVTVLSVLGVAALFSLKLHIFFGRYFTEILPAFYLLCVLLFAPLLRRFNWACILFTVVLVSSLYVYHHEYPIFQHPFRFAARITSAYWRDVHPQEELWVISISGYPKPSMETMYGFYLNEIWKQNVGVKELYQLPKEERNKLLDSQPEKVIYMPQCMHKDLARLNKEWNRIIAMRQRMGATCYIQLSPEGETRPPQFWISR